MGQRAIFLNACRDLTWPKQLTAFGSLVPFGDTSMRSKLAPACWCILVLAFSVRSFSAPPNVVQYASYQTSGSNGENSSSVQFNAPTSAGNAIWVVVTLSDADAVNTLAVTDTQGNVYTQLEQENDGAPGSQTVAEFYASNIVGDATAPNTVTLSTAYENYRGLLVAEIGGTAAVPLVGSSGNIQDALGAGSNGVTSGSIAVGAGQTPALLTAVSMNTSGLSSGDAAPASGAGFSQVAQMWNWGSALATFETAAISSAGNSAALFNALFSDSYVTVAAVFLPAVPQAPPAVNISASPTAIIVGGSSTLTWASPNATACTASGNWTGPEPTSGALTVSPTATAIYTLTCTGPAGASAPVSATVSVNPPLPTVALAADANSIVDGGSAVLSWSSTSAASCAATGGWSGTKAGAGTVAVSPKATSAYSMTCSNSSGASPASSVTVTVTPAPPHTPKVTLSASPASLASGGSSTLTWSATDATSCAASNAWSGIEAVSGNLLVTPAATSIYTLACANATVGSPPRSIVVAVAPPKPTVAISASPGLIAAGASSVISWTSTNAASCAASGAWSGTLPASGTQTVTPSATGRYSIVCSNVTGNSGVESVPVSVVSATAPAVVQYATHQTAGSDTENNSTAQFNALTQPGDTIWVAATVSDYAGVHAISVTDSQGNVYTKLDQKNDHGQGSQSVAHFYAANIAGDTSRPDTITIHWTNDDYKGILIAEISGATAAPLVGHSAQVQDRLAAGSGNVTAGSMTIASTQLPALVIGLSMNTTGGTSDLGGNGYGGPAAGSGFTPLAEFWNWGANLATLESAPATTPENASALFNALGADSYVTVSAVFY
jgi:hypothetical protein